MEKPTLHASDPLQKALPSLLAWQLAVIRDNQPDFSASDQDNKLHDYRVAIRRTRSLLSEFNRYFHKPAIQHFRQEFLWVFEKTSQARDLDVHLAELTHYQTLLPNAYADDLQRLRNQLLTQQQLAYQELRSTLGSQRYQQLLNEWPDYLATCHLFNAQHKKQLIGPSAQRQIHARLEKILGSGLALHLDAPDEHYHDLRKDCKKLRYLLEFFGCFFASPITGPFVEQLKKLQDYLGKHQDLCVQIQLLEHLEIGPPEPWEMLMAQLQIEKTNQRVKFKTCFQPFSEAKAIKKIMGTIAY